MLRLALVLAALLAPLAGASGVYVGDTARPATIDADALDASAQATAVGAGTAADAPHARTPDARATAPPVRAVVVTSADDGPVARVEAGDGGVIDAQDPDTLRMAAAVAPGVLPIALGARVDATRAIHVSSGEAAPIAGTSPALALAGDEPRADAMRALREARLASREPARAKPDELPPAGPSAEVATMEAAGGSLAPPPREDEPVVALVVATAALALAPIALYHQLRKEAAGTRARVLERVRAAPGEGAAATARAIGLDATTVAYHLRRLERDQLVVAEGEGRARRYFAVGAASPAQRVALLAERASVEMLSLVRAEPGLSKTEIARRLQVARATVTWHVGRLARAGLVRIERDGRRAMVHPVERQPFS